MKKKVKDKITDKETIKYLRKTIRRNEFLIKRFREKEEEYLDMHMSILVNNVWVSITREDHHKLIEKIGDDFRKKQENKKIRLLKKKTIKRNAF